MSATQRGDPTGTRHPTPVPRRIDARSGSEARDAEPAVAHVSDPRLGQGGGAIAGLLALQRSAGNAAVASMVSGETAVQRAVTIDEIDVTATERPAAAAASPAATASPAAAASPAGTGAGAVTSDGGTTTITGGVVNIQGGQVNLDAAMTHASGVLQADTVIADSIVAASYSPGAGNVW